MRTSEVLTRLANEPGERLSVEAIFANLGDRSFGLLIFLLGLPNCVPMTPPVPSVSAVLLLSVAAQIAYGRPTPWAPRILLTRSVARSDVRRAADKVTPWLAWLEKWTRPRLQWTGKRLGGLLIALLIVMLSLGVLTCAPVIGQIPFGLGICLLGLGLVEEDGALLIPSVACCAIGLSLSASFVYALIIALANLLG